MMDRRRQQLTVTGFGLLYGSIMGTALLAASRFEWFAGIVIWWIFLPAAVSVVILMVVARRPGPESSKGFESRDNDGS